MAAMVPLDVVLTAIDAAIRLDIPLRELRARIAALAADPDLSTTRVPQQKELTKAAKLACSDPGADELGHLWDSDPDKGPDWCPPGNGTYREE